MSHSHHDTHILWKSNDKSDNMVWDYYNNVVSLQIVREAISRHQPLTLFSLYHTLARARVKCEWVKEQLKLTKNRSNEDLEYAVTIEMAVYCMTGEFGKFIPDRLKGSNAEPNLFSNVRGKYILKLLEKRFPDRIMHSTEFKDYTLGLSTISVIEEYQRYSIFTKKSAELFHPKANMMTIADRDFQSLLSTNNIFDFFTIASRLMFHLSNFPPIIRGSAAVNSWLIDHVFNIKFNVKNSIRPSLYDWTAFFETFEQYKTFYVISASIEYLKSIKIFCEPHCLLLYEWINEVMLSDPNDPAVLLQRETAWEQLKLRIRANIEGFKDTQKENLQNILDGQLQFRAPSPAITKFLKMIEREENFTVKQIKGWIDLNYLKRVMKVNEDTAKKYLKFQGSLAEENFNSLWADLSYLRMKLGPDKFVKLEKMLELDFDLNPINFLSGLFKSNANDDGDDAVERKISKASSSTSTQSADKQHETDDTNSTLEVTYPELQVKSLNKIPMEHYETHLLDICLAEFSDVMKLRDDQKILLLSGFHTNELINPRDQSDIFNDRKMRLYRAIISGGIRIQDMQNLSTAMLEVLISPAANLLYHSNLFIHSNDLKTDTVIKTELNILRLLAKHYCNQTLSQIPDVKIQRLLLSYPELFQTKKLSLSTIDDSIENVEKYLLKTYIHHFYEEHRFDEMIDKFTSDQIHRYLNKVKKLFILIDWNDRQTNMLSQRRYLNENGLSAFGLMQLEEAEIKILMEKITHRSDDSETHNSAEWKRIKQKYDELTCCADTSTSHLAMKK